MLKWYWKARLYRPNGDYYHCQIPTERNLHDIDLVQDFYCNLTGCKLLLEGMSEQPYNLPNALEAFTNLWKERVGPAPS